MVYEENLMRERILKLIHRLGISQREFANQIGRQQSNVSQALSGERHIPRGFSSDILRRYPHVNKDWLLFGDGNMIEGEEDFSEAIPADTKPRLPRTLSEGHLQDYFEGDKRKLCDEKRIVTQFPNYDFSLFLKTDRMAPNYRRGDELFFKKTAITEWGSCYLLDTAEGPKFKKIYEEKGGIRCVSYNKEEYPDFVIPRNLIYGFYKCVGVLRII